MIYGQYRVFAPSLPPPSAPAPAHAHPCTLLWPREKNEYLAIPLSEWVSDGEVETVQVSGQSVLLLEISWDVRTLGGVMPQQRFLLSSKANLLPSLSNEGQMRSHGNRLKRAPSSHMLAGQLMRHPSSLTPAAASRCLYFQTPQPQTQTQTQLLELASCVCQRPSHPS
jgi:hypothetical protein